VTANGVTTQYASLTEAWTEAVKKMGSGATVTMLKDASVESTLTTGTSGTLTLDLNDHVLAYVGQSDNNLIKQDGGTLHVVDTATTRSPRYFTRNETTGLWTLTNEETDLSVKGGLLTGARNSAIYYFSGTHSISNVNFVGNASTFNGGALTTFNAIISLAITDCAFLGNVAAKSGGAVSSGNVTMTDCVVEQNVAAEKGGGVYVRDHGSLVRTTVVNNKAKTGGGIHVTNDPGGCFPAGVKILMADGTEKAIEEIAEGDVVATFDHEGGVKSSAAVFYVYQGTDAQDVFTLSFASGTTLDIADHHDLLLETTRKYVTIAYDNARSFIGGRFYNYATGDWDELTDVTSAKGCDAYYSLYTSGHANCVANGMLTVSDDKDFYLNVYVLDENLKADAEQLAADIAAYGLATPEDYPNIPLDDFADSNMRYARIAIAKGLTTQAEIRYWNEYDYGPIVAKKTKGALKLTTSSIEAVSPTAAYLQVGEGTVITGNVNTAGADNAYLDKSNNAVIDILSGTTHLDIGVTLSSNTGVFGWTNNINYASSFTSDNPDYAVAYTADKTLALRAGVQVGDDAWALIKGGVCTVSGTGDMWSYARASASPLLDYGVAITNLVVESGVTSVGANVFTSTNFWYLADVTLGADCTNVAARAFKKCYGLTNVVSRATGALWIGDYAFAGCHSLQAMDFGDEGKPEFGEGAYTFRTVIYMRDGIPDIYPVPALTMGNYNAVKQGSNDLENWTEIDDETKKDYHFFRIVLEPKM